MRQKTFTFGLALAIAPSIALAQQASSGVQGGAAASAAAKAPHSHAAVSGSAQASSPSATAADVPSTFTAENRAKLDATFAAASERGLPTEPIRDRISEGRAKGASEAQIVLAAQHAEARLETTQRAMIRAGRREPSQKEVASGYQAMAHGATEAQIEAVTQHTPSNRSLVVAFDALARLEAQGMSSDRAVARVASLLEARASDQAIGQLDVASGAQANGSVNAPRHGISAAGSTTVAGSVTGNRGAGATAGVAGATGVVIKPPVE